MIWSQFLALEPMAKARPRVTRGGKHTYLPRTYMDWRQRFVAFTKRPRQPIEGRLRVRVVVRTKTGRMRPDLDNVFGAVADALQDAKVIANDRAIDALWCSIEKDCNPGIWVEVESIP